MPMLMLITVMADTVDMADTVTDTVMADTAMDTVMAVTDTDTARDLLNPKLTDTVMAMDTDMADTAVDTAAMAAMVIIMENDLPKLNLIMAVMVMADTAVVMAVMVATATVDVTTDKFF